MAPAHCEGLSWTLEKYLNLEVLIIHSFFNKRLSINMVKLQFNAMFKSKASKVSSLILNYQEVSNLELITS